MDKGGERHLTRDGRFALDANRTLTLAGDPAARVLDAAGLPIVLPPGLSPHEIQIDDGGRLRNAATGQPLAAIGLSVPIDPAALRPIGGGLFAPTPARPADPAQVAVRAGYVEQSNVDPTAELTRLVEVGRLLELNATFIRHQDSALGKLIESAAID